MIAAGTILATLSSRSDLDAQHAMAQAQIDQAQAALDKLRAGARPEEIAEAQARAQQANAAASATRGSRSEDIAVAEAQLAQAQAGVDKAQLDSDRPRTGCSRRSAIAQGRGGQRRHAAADREGPARRAAEDPRGAARRRAHGGQGPGERDSGGEREPRSSSKNGAHRGSAHRRTGQRGARALAQLGINKAELAIRAPIAARVESFDPPGRSARAERGNPARSSEDQLYVRIYVPETQIGLWYRTPRSRSASTRFRIGRSRARSSTSPSREVLAAQPAC